MTEPSNESELISSAIAGDEQAFTQLVSQYRPQVYGIVKRMIGHPEDTEDIVQEALLKAWKALGTFKQESRLSTWLIAIATRTAIDVLRHQKRWRAEAQVAYANLCSQSEELSGEVIAQYASPDFSYEVREHISYCFSCLGRSLPPDEWAALLLRDVVSLSAQEASNILGISDSVLRHRLSAARRSMQDQYEGLCALVNKTGICHQCAGLQMIAAGRQKRWPVSGGQRLCRSLRRGTGMPLPFHARPPSCVLAKNKGNRRARAGINGAEQSLRRG